MADNNMMSLNINKDMLVPVIEQHVKMMMAEIMGGKDEIVDKVITSVLYSKVDKNGKTSSYSSDNTYTYMEWLITSQIETVVRELIKEEVTSYQGQIKECLKKNLQSKKGSETFAAAILSAFSDSIASDWRTKFNIEISLPEDKY